MTRSRSAMRASTRSPARTLVAGFAGNPFTRTWPPSHSRVASGRVFTRRTAHSQRAMRVSSAALGSVTRSMIPRVEEALRRPLPPVAARGRLDWASRPATRKPDREGPARTVSQNWSGPEEPDRHYTGEGAERIHESRGAAYPQLDVGVGPDVGRFQRGDRGQELALWVSRASRSGALG